MKYPHWLLLICTGGLICRAVLETVPIHNVHNFISLSSPQGGQFGGKVLVTLWSFYER